MSTASNPSDEDVVACVRGIFQELEDAQQQSIAAQEQAQAQAEVRAIEEATSAQPEKAKPDAKTGGKKEEKAPLKISPIVLGAHKLLVQVKYKHPTWELSEKRFKRLLRAEGISFGEQAPVKEGDEAVNGSAKETNGTNGKSSSSSNNNKKKKKKGPKKHTSDGFIPASHVDELLPLPSNIKTHYFDSVKGKGIIATRDFKEGELIFTEDAYVCAPPAAYIKNVNAGELCDACFAPLANNKLAVECSYKKDGCASKWCNRLCWNRATCSHHPLLCNGRNPLVRKFNKFSEEVGWGSAVISARALARVLLTHSARPTPTLKGAKTTDSSAASIATISGQTEPSAPPATAHEVLAHLDAFATVNELSRRTRSAAWPLEQDHYLRHLTACHQLIVEAMHPYAQERAQIEALAAQPMSVSNAANIRLAKKCVADYPVDKKTFPKDLLDRPFNLNAWCDMLGRANINVENHGSMYLVHSQLNHSCEPNVAVRHIAAKGAVRPATKVSVIAARDIKEGEELFVTYIQVGPQEDGTPGPNVRRRRQVLWREYMFGPCECPRCLRELAEMPQEERDEILTEIKTGDWKRDKEQEAAVQQRIAQVEADMANKAEADAESSKKPEEKKDLNGLADEVKTALGF